MNVLKTVPCEAPDCHRVLVQYDAQPMPRWEPSCPYWNPHTDQTLCRPCYWISLYPNTPVAPAFTYRQDRDRGSRYPGKVVA